MFNNIVLIGFMGAGKTTIGRELAKKLDLVLLDSDSIIEVNCGMSVNEIFVRYGEKYFRECEIKLCEWIKNNVKNAVISTGGGMPMQYDMRDIGNVFYLQAPIEALIERIETDGISKRPVYRRFKVSGDLYNQRVKKYELQADYTLNAMESISEITTKIYNHIKAY
ncbi:MAG: shikimate kinase [Helicobacteraceae bacterium]|nr:shikimate kinase [Helicobacteraceae bacterium]